MKTLLITLACASATIQSGAVIAQEPQSSCIGSYNLELTFVGPDATRPYVVSLLPGGIVIASPPGAVSTFTPGGAEVELSSSSQGIWKDASNSSCDIYLEGIDAYPNGDLSGRSVAKVNFSVEAGKVSLKGTALAMNMDRTVRGELELIGTGSKMSFE